MEATKETKSTTNARTKPSAEKKPKNESADVLASRAYRERCKLHRRQTAMVSRHANEVLAVDRAIKAHVAKCEKLPEEARELLEVFLERAAKKKLISG